MNKYLLSLIIILLSFPAIASDKLTASERVVKTNILKCGYGGGNPYYKKDPNTGEISGMYVEILQEAAKLLSLKIEWAEEVGYAEFAEGIKVGRYDAFCAPIGIIPSRARVATSAAPLAYNPQFIYQAEGQPISADYNVKEIKAATTDGESFQIMTKRFLPNATEYSLPSMTPPSNLFIDVAVGKADVVIHDPVNINEFNRNNIGKFKLVATSKFPLSITPTTAFTVLPEDTHLLNMMNVAFQTLLDNGKVEEIFMKYGVTPDVLYRIPPNYQKPE